MFQQKNSPRRWAKWLVRSAAVAPVAIGILMLLPSGASATTTDSERLSSATTTALADDTELNEDWMPVHGSE